MTKINIFLITIVCFGLSQPAYTKSPATEQGQHCSDPIVNFIGDQFALDYFSYPEDGNSPSVENGGLIVAGVCKAWPEGGSKTIAIFAYDEGKQSEKKLIVALVDRRKWKLVASHVKSIQEDAYLTIGSTSFRIDTARYYLAPGIRAFGLDVNTTYHQGCVDGGIGAERTLFVQHGKKIRPILEGMYMSTWSFIKGGPSCAYDEKEVVTENTVSSISVSKTFSHGYANLLVKEVSTYSNGDKSKRRESSYEMQYDGKEYLTPTAKALRGLQ